MASHGRQSHKSCSIYEGQKSNYFKSYKMFYPHVGVHEFIMIVTLEYCRGVGTKK
jgi:hypothetical protein